VPRAHLPGPAAQSRPPGDPEEHERGAVVDSERGEPENGPRRTLGQRPADPQRACGAEPSEDPPGALALERAGIASGEGQEAVTADLNRDVGAGEQQRLVAERLGDRDREQQVRDRVTANTNTRS
jgi:hypothetical protein